MLLSSNIIEVNVADDESVVEAAALPGASPLADNPPCGAASYIVCIKLFVLRSGVRVTAERG